MAKDFGPTTPPTVSKRRLFKPTEGQEEYGQKVRAMASKLMPFSGEFVNLPMDDKKIFINTPPDFRPQYPSIVGPSNMAQYVEDIFKLVPELRGRIPRVQGGISHQSQELIDMRERLFKPGEPHQRFTNEDFPGLSVLGITNPESGEITINPSLTGATRNRYIDPNQLPEVVAHEMSHVAGANDFKDTTGIGPTSYQLGEMFTRASKSKK